jgi:hypothetical protein
LAFQHINLVSHIAFCQSLACVRSLFQTSNPFPPSGSCVDRETAAVCCSHVANCTKCITPWAPSAEANPSILNHKRTAQIYPSQASGSAHLTLLLESPACLRGVPASVNQQNPGPQLLVYCHGRALTAPGVTTPFHVPLCAGCSAAAAAAMTTAVMSSCHLPRGAAPATQDSE